MGAAVVSMADQDLYRIHFKSQPKHEKIGPLVIKISVVVLTVLALAAATYFSFGLALPIFAGAATWVSGLGTLAVFGLGVAAFTAPALALPFNMYRSTHQNEKDIINFLRAISLVVLFSIGAFAFQYFRIYK